MYRHFFKRLIDFCIALIALPFVLLLCIFVWLAIKLDDGGPLFHMASRIGKGGRIFKMFKFRSMIVNAPDLRMEDGSTYNAEDDPRVTRVGRFLRKTSLDELPQLYNILIGDMSFVGPRPERRYFIDKIMKYDSRYKYLYEIQPGLTSEATLHNGYTDTMEKMLKRLDRDLYYLENRSLAIDLKILLETVVAILIGKKI